MLLCSCFYRPHKVRAGLTLLDQSSGTSLSYSDKMQPWSDLTAEVAELPAILHIDNDCNIVGRAEGWQPDEWRELAHRLAKDMSWSAPPIPKVGDPVAFAGSPAT